MVAALVFSLIGMAVDPRIIAGAPAWLKPAKFAISTAIYMFTFAWIFTYLTDWPRLRRWVEWITAVVLVLEVAIIDVQAARGTTSHFNVASPLDAVLFNIMGVAILVAWVASIFVTAALFRQKFAEQGIGWGFRLGLLITVIGASVGGVMVAPRSAQLAQAKETHHMNVSGSHTIGAPDGGPGMPGTGWSREHGDLRVSHFMGLHAMQVLPLFAWLFERRRPGPVMIAATIYVGIVAFLFVQAMQGKPFLGGVL